MNCKDDKMTFTFSDFLQDYIYLQFIPNGDMYPIHIQNGDMDTTHFPQTIIHEGDDMLVKKMKEEIDKIIKDVYPSFGEYTLFTTKHDRQGNLERTNITGEVEASKIKDYGIVKFSTVYIESKKNGGRRRTKRRRTKRRKTKRRKTKRKSSRKKRRKRRRK